MTLINQIIQDILPELNKSVDVQEKESNVLSQFTAILLAKIVGDDDITITNDSSSVEIIKSVFPSSEERGELIVQLAEENIVDEKVTQQIVQHATPLITAAAIKKATAEDKDLKTFLKDNLGSFGASLPSWSTSMMPASILGGLGAIGLGIKSVTKDDNISALSDSANLVTDKVTDVQTVVTDKTPDINATVADNVKHVDTNTINTVAASETSLMSKLFPLLGLILVGVIGLFMWNSCSQQPTTPVATQDSHAEHNHDADHTDEHTDEADAVESNTDGATVDEADKEDATLNLTTDADGNLGILNGTLGNDALQGTVVGAITGSFGESDSYKEGLTIADSHKTTLPNSDKLAEALAAVKGVPHATVNLKGNAIVVNAKDPADRKALAEKLQGMLPEYTVTEAKALDVDAVVTQGIEGSLEALGKLEGQPVTSKNIAEALNIQVINFPSGRFVIPAKNQVVLDKAIALMKSNQDAKLAITGHTDSTGNAAKNQKLSESRAKAVKEYFINKGVPEAQLTSTGVGSSQSIASDATKAGQFQNRRISFEGTVSSTATTEEKDSSVLNAVANVASNVAAGATDAGSAIAEGVKEASKAAAE